MRVVLDTVILIRGLIGPHSRWGRILFERNNEYRWIVSASIVEEYLDVLMRPEIARKYRTVGTRDVMRILEYIAAAKVVEPKAISRTCRDPEDDKFLAAAKAGDAQCIVTEDSDLLSLQSFEQVLICTAEEFINRLDESAKLAD